MDFISIIISFLVSLKMADLFSLAALTQMTDASEDFGSILATGLSKKSTGKRKRERRK
jgi:hypothetical protein